MITLTKTELNWLVSWIKEAEQTREEILQQGPDAMVQHSLESCCMVRKKLQTMIESGQKRIEIK